MAGTPALALLVLLLLSNNVLHSVADEEVVIANIGEDVLFVDRPLTLRCLSRNPQFISLSWWKGRVKMAEVSNSGDITLNVAVGNVTFTYNGNIFAMDFAALSVKDGGVYSCTVATSSGAESTEIVQFEVYTRDQCVANSNGKQEYLVSDIPSVLLLKCTYPSLQSGTLKTSWFDGISNLDGILTFSPVSNAHSTSVKALYSVDQEKNGTILTCLVGEQASTLSPSSAVFSCSLGPLYFYDRPFVEIIPIDVGLPAPGGDDNMISGSDGIAVASFSCRLVPSSLDANLTWTVLSQFSNPSVEYLDDMSILSFDIPEIQDENEWNVACAVETQDGFYSASRNFTVLFESNKATTSRMEYNATFFELPVVPEHAGNADPLNSLRVLVIVLAVTVVVLVLVLLQILFWCLIRRYDRRRQLRVLDVKNVHGRPNPTADTTSVSGLTNDGFSEPPRYNDIFMTSESRAMSIIDRRVEIKDEEEDDSSNDIIDEELTRRFQRQSTVSTFSDIDNYTPVDHRFSRRSTASMFAEGYPYTPVDRLGRQHSCPPSTDRDEPLYDSAPSVSTPIYARSNKLRKPAPAQTRRNGSISSEQSGQRNISLDDESGISLSEQPSADEIYFELTEGEIESTAC